MMDVVFYVIFITALCFVVDSFITLLVVSDYNKEEFAKRCNIYIGFEAVFLILEVVYYLIESTLL